MEITTNLMNEVITTHIDPLKESNLKLQVDLETQKQPQTSLKKIWQLWDLINKVWGPKAEIWSPLKIKKKCTWANTPNWRET